MFAIISGAVSLISFGIKTGASETAKKLNALYEAASEAIATNQAFLGAASDAASAEMPTYKKNNTALVIIIASLLLIAVIVIVIIKKK